MQINNKSFNTNVETLKKLTEDTKNETDRTISGYLSMLYGFFDKKKRTW
ncbi:MAG: hypothetical protein HZC28_16335 [Spirochaetes bacterium]|nr:hypothetical protein [Spirochaetota bacterium]